MVPLATVSEALAFREHHRSPPDDDGKIDDEPLRVHRGSIRPYVELERCSVDQERVGGQACYKRVHKYLLTGTKVQILTPEEQLLSAALSLMNY